MLFAFFDITELFRFIKKLSPSGYAPLFWHLLQIQVAYRAELLHEYAGLEFNL